MNCYTSFNSIVYRVEKAMVYCHKSLERRGIWMSEYFLRVKCLLYLNTRFWHYCPASRVLNSINHNLSIIHWFILGVTYLTSSKWRLIRIPIIFDRNYISSTIANTSPTSYHPTTCWGKHNHHPSHENVVYWETEVKINILNTCGKGVI